MRTLALIKRICLEMLRDKRTLALLFVAPLLILTLMYFLFNGNTVNPKLGVVNVNSQLIHVLEQADINITEYNNVTDASKMVVDDDLDGLLENVNEKLVLTLQNSDPSSAKVLQMKVNQIASQIQSPLQDASNNSTNSTMVETKYVYGSSETVFFNVLSPILVGFFVFFFVFLIAGIGLLKERTKGTLERLLSTPIRRVEIVTAYLVGYGIFAVIQTVIVVFYAIHVLDMVLVGSIWLVLLINLLISLVALSLGTLLSAFATSEFQMIQFIPIAVVPQVFFSGIFPLESMANWLQVVSKIMPLYYGAHALKGVMYQGLGLNDIIRDIIVLVGFALVFVVLNIFALKRYRKL